MSHDTWRMGFHLMPPTGWLNDPNGLCQLDGTYHVFYQYSPDWPAPDAPRGWGHFASEDLVRWRAVDREFVIAPDTPDEASGAYSGCAVPYEGGARLYYTGNVKEPGDFDYVHDGRRSVQILVESPDGYRMGEKSVLLRNADYPAFCTRHVRDPKVWREGGTWWMVLGARDLDDHGLALVLRSADGLAWENAGTVRPAEPFGYMWECPDRIELGGREWLSFCPQGMQGLPWANGIRDQAGYVPMAPGARLCEGAVVDAGSFRRWDCGFDFYAPQTFVDESGRTLLIAWMGLPEADFESAPDGMTWCHCLTVPREVTAGAGGRAPPAAGSRARGAARRAARARGGRDARAGRAPCRRPSRQRPGPARACARRRAPRPVGRRDTLAALCGRRRGLRAHRADHHLRRPARPARAYRQLGRGGLCQRRRARVCHALVPPRAEARAPPRRRRPRRGLGDG